MSTTDPDDPTLALTCELIARQSVTPDDAGCQDAMASRLKQAGFSVDAMRFGDVDNFWATHGTSGPLLVFAGHTDVVPPGDEAHWDSDPFEATVIGDELFGRGAADMKAGSDLLRQLNRQSDALAGVECSSFFCRWDLMVCPSWRAVLPLGVCEEIPVLTHKQLISHPDAIRRLCSSLRA